MSCTKVITGKLRESYGPECLYQGEFLQLDNELQYVRHAKIVVMKDKICLASLNDDGHEELGDCSNNCFEIARSFVNIDFIKNSPYTFKLSVKHAENETNVYQLCDRQDSWPEFLRSFDLHDSVEQTSSKSTRVLPKVTFDEMDDYISESESECSSLSEGSSADDIGLPRCFTLCAVQGLGTMSMYNVNNAMMMMNPGHVRRLNKDTGTRRGSIDFLGLTSSDSDESLRHSNSYPQLSYNTKTERSRSLPNLTDLDNVLVDEDLRYGSFNRPKRGQHCGFGYNRNIHRYKDAENPANLLSLVEYRTEYGKKHANNHRELCLNEEIRKLIAQPSSIKFCNTAGRSQDAKHENKLDPICETVCTQEHFEPLKAPIEQPKSRPYEAIDTTGGKFKLSWKFWKRREKLNINKSGVKSDASAQQESGPEHVVFINKLAVDYKCNISTMPSYAVSSDRRGGLGSDASGKKDQVNTSTVTRQKDYTSPAGVQPKEKTKLTSNSQPTFTGKDTIRKKIVKRILSPITILRSVSEEEKNITDHHPTEVYSPGYVGKCDDVLVQSRPKKLLDMNPLYLAQELSLIDKELLVRIPWNELSTCGWMTKHKYQRSPSVLAMVEFFNRIALLVASEILFEVDPMMRVRVISKVIQVANKLRAMGNFNSLKALLGGLQCTPIYRLKETWKEVSSKRKKNFRDLTKLMSEEDNFAAYRNEVDNLMNQKAACLPFLGDFLTQIAQTQTYIACRKKKSPEPPKNEASSATESDASPTTPTPQPIEKQSSNRKTPSRTSLVKRRSTSIRMKDIRFSKSSPNLPASCTRTPDRTPCHYRSNRFRRCRSWQHSNDSGIQVNSNNSSLSASSNSFLTSNTSLGSGTFAFHARNGTSEERTNTPRTRDLGRSSSTSTPISVKNSRKFKLRRNQSVSEKCLSVSDSGTSLKTRLSFMRSFRRSKSVDQSPSSAESIQKLYSVRMENGGSPGKTTDVKDARTIPEPETTDETGTELQLWHFHVAAIQYSFPSRPHIKDFLLSTAFNSEENNYKLSLQREPPARKAASVS